jgi:hypothetical protein
MEAESASPGALLERPGHAGRTFVTAGLQAAGPTLIAVAITPLRQTASGAGSAAARTRWLARGAWLLAAAEALVAVRNHLADRLDERDRRRLVEIVKTSKGRPSNLDDRERKELQRLIGKVEPRELIKTVARSGALRRRR